VAKFFDIPLEGLNYCTDDLPAHVDGGNIASH
jgi:hypothetical protein